MSNNAYVTPDGLEIGRAQAEQARAARIDPDVRMNPVLLKPEGNMRSQVVLMGRPSGMLTSRDFDRKAHLWPSVVSSLDSLRAEYDLVIIEGAGSPAEVNLRRGDIVNMALALHAEAPVLLVGDIDNGGVMAHIVGTLALVRPRERALIKGFLINKFRGDISLFRPGIEFLERRTKRPVLGVMPYVSDLQVAEEDAVALDRPVRNSGSMPRGSDIAPSPPSPPLILRLSKDRPRARGSQTAIHIAVARLPHIANFDDFDPLAADPRVHLSYVRHPEELADADLIVLPGTKNTRDDLAWLRETGLANTVIERANDGVPVIGVCGGFQMLGRVVHDPDGVEGAPGSLEGLGLLPVRTVFEAAKVTRQVSARVLASDGLLDGASGVALTGYEIHMGRTTLAGCDPGFLIEDAGETREDGAISPDGRIMGTYMHGLFANDALRARLLANLTGEAVEAGVPWDPEAGIDRLAAVAREHLHIDAIARIAGL
jgi:adenosylcobyric acid synthase